MKLTLFLALLSPITWAQLDVKPEYEECGGNFNCYYEKKAEEKQQEQESQEKREELLHLERLEMQEEQLEEIRQQTELLDNNEQAL